MPADYSRVHRVLRILMLIQSQRGWNVPRLVEQLGVSERSVYRDLRTLQDLGVPYHFDTETDGYRVRHDFFMPPVSLTAEEALALIAMVQGVADTEQIPFFKPAARAVEKVRAHLPVKVMEEIGDLDAARGGAPCPGEFGRRHRRCVRHRAAGHRHATRAALHLRVATVASGSKAQV